ncbi:MAG: formyltransferase family protein [Beijerinckiaceae bacterium]
MRVALFGSFHRGHAVLDELLRGPLASRITIVGVATDDPDQPYVSAHKRVWQYPHEAHERVMVKEMARKAELPVYRGRVKTPEFYAIYENDWRPDICFMATFGQKIDRRLFSLPRKGFFNLHPSDLGDWPSRYAGPNPFHEMLNDGRDTCAVTLHMVDDGFDTGERMAVSPPIAIPKGASVTDLHKITAPHAALLVRGQLDRALADDRVPQRASETTCS